MPWAITSRPSAKEKARANSSPCGLLSARALQRWPVFYFFSRANKKARANDPRHRGYHQLGLSKHWPFITLTFTMRLHRRQYSSKFSAVVSGRICSRYRGCSQVGHKAQPFLTAIILPCFSCPCKSFSPLFTLFLPITYYFQDQCRARVRACACALPYRRRKCTLQTGLIFQSGSFEQHCPEFG